MLTGDLEFAGGVSLQDTLSNLHDRITALEAAIETLLQAPPHRQRQQGRPKDGPEDKFRLTPCGARLSELLSCSVSKVDDCVGDVVKDAVAGMDNGSVCLLENVRFYKDEEKNGKDFAKQLAKASILLL